MKRYEEFVLEAEKGISFETEEGKNGELIIKAMHKEKDDNYSENYKNPPILDGFEHVLGEWHNGFVISKRSNGNEYVWIPVGYLNSNGTLDGKEFNRKFGIRNYLNQPMESQFYEPLTTKLAFQSDSVKKYGGFYLSSNLISKGYDGKPRSVKGEYPWVNVNYFQAYQIASMLEESEMVNSHLIFGSEKDSVIEWFIKSNARTLHEVIEDSTNWGNYWNSKNSTKIIEKTGSNEKYCTNNIYDFTGNVLEWTQEKGLDGKRVIRGGSCIHYGSSFPANSRRYTDPRKIYKNAGFRAALYIK